MKKISTLLASLAVAAAVNAVSAETWDMPGSYNNWNCEKNTFVDNGDGTWSQTIEDLYGDFKILKYETPNWENQWVSNGETVKNNVVYTAKYGGNSGDNIYMDGSGDNLHYYNAKVTITPGADNALTILVEAERVATPDDEWYIVGAKPFEWGFAEQYKFEKVEDDTWAYTVAGTVDGDFKIVKNAAWNNSYSTSGEVALGEVYTLTGPKDPIDNMKPVKGEKWVNPTFTLTVGDVITLKVTAENQSGIEAVEASEVAGAAVYYNLQGQRVANPENGLYIRVQGGKATKVVL